MDFDPKTSRLHNKEVDKFLANYDFRLNSEIRIKFSPHGVDVSLASPNDGIYMHPQVLALELRLPMTRFVRSALIFYQPALLSFWQWPAYNTRIQGLLCFVRSRNVSV